MNFLKELVEEKKNSQPSYFASNDSSKLNSLANYSSNYHNYNHFDNETNEDSYKNYSNRPITVSLNEPVNMKDFSSTRDDRSNKFSSQCNNKFLTKVGYDHASGVTSHANTSLYIKTVECMYLSSFKNYRT